MAHLCIDFIDHIESYIGLSRFQGFFHKVATSSLSCIHVTEAIHCLSSCFCFLSSLSLCRLPFHLLLCHTLKAFSPCRFSPQLCCPHPECLISLLSPSFFPPISSSTNSYECIMPGCRELSRAILLKSIVSFLCPLSWYCSPWWKVSSCWIIITISSRLFSTTAFISNQWYCGGCSSDPQQPCLLFPILIISLYSRFAPGRILAREKVSELMKLAGETCIFDTHQWGEIIQSMLIGGCRMYGFGRRATPECLKKLQTGIVTVVLSQTL